MDHNFKDILHNVNLTEGQISVILYVLEEKVSELDNFDTDDKNEELREDIEAIFQELEGSVDRFYDNMEKKQKQQPVAEWTD
jgi:predicted DNA-binding antitoxin AbrB/MazE fold protein